VPDGLGAGMRVPGAACRPRMRSASSAAWTGDVGEMVRDRGDSDARAFFPERCCRFFSPSRNAIMFALRRPPWWLCLAGAESARPSDAIRLCVRGGDACFAPGGLVRVGVLGLAALVVLRVGLGVLAAAGEWVGFFEPLSGLKDRPEIGAPRP